MNLFRAYLTIFLLFFYGFTFAQSIEQDSIVKDLNNYKKRDSIRITRLIKIVNFYNSRDISKTKNYIEEAISIAKEINSENLKGKLYRTYASYFLKKGYKDKALEHALISIKIFDSLKIEQEQLLTNGLLLSIYGNSGYFDKALKIGLNNIKLIKNNPEITNKGRYYYDLANVYRALEDYKKTEENYLIALDYAKNNEPAKYTLIMSLGELYKRDKKYAKARLYITKALIYYTKNKQNARIAHANYFLATIFSLENKHKEATSLYNKALNHFVKTNNLHYQKMISQNLYINYNIIQDYKKAHEINKIYNAAKDTIESKERIKYIAQMKTKYETEKIKTEKNIVELKNKQNKTYFFSSLIVGLLLVLLSLFYINRLQVKRKSELISLELSETKKRLDLEKQYRNSELKALKSQMNPHFMFNAMNSIQSLILKGEKEDAYKYLTKFSSLIRENLNMSENNFVYFDEELTLINTYLELEKLRFKSDFNYSIQGLEDIEDIKIPSMVIQPFIENAIKHGLLHKKGHKELSIVFKQEEVLKCTIYDNGVGRKASEEINKNKIDKYASFSSGAIAKRFLLLKEYYELDLGFAYNDLTDKNNNATGTKVTIKIPYI